MSSEPRPATYGPADQSRPNVARMYDYYLGGSHNFAIDREAAEKVLAIFPDTPFAAQTSRHFMRRAVRFLAAEQGVRQFIDVGAGLPTQGGVHEIIGPVVPDGRVVYVDNDPVAVAHARRLLTGVPGTGVCLADLRDPASVLESPEVRDLIDPAEPVALLLVSILHFVTDEEDPYGIVRRLRDATCPGSWLVMSQLTADGAPPAGAEQGRAVYRQASAPITPRDHAAQLRFFDGYELVEPGLVLVADWRPESDDVLLRGVSHGYGGVGRKR